MALTSKQVEDAAELGARRAIQSYNDDHQKQHRDERNGFRWLLGFVNVIWLGLIAFLQGK